MNGLVTKRWRWATSLALGLACATTGGMLWAQDPVPTQKTPARKMAKRAERHPKIHEAIRALKEAKVELEAAAHDYGGHRVQAIKDIDATLLQLQLALKFGHTHDKKTLPATPVPATPAPPGGAAGS